MKSHQFSAKDLELDGQLARKLKLWRKQGKSYRWIASKLSESGVYVNKDIPRRWCADLGIK